MKKIKLLMISICLFIFPFSVYAENCSPDDIIITSIELKNLTGNAEEIETTIENKKINMNVKLKEVGDSIDYEVKVKNNSNEEYYLNDTSMSMSNEYINYTISYEDNSNIVQPKSNKNVNIKVEYKEEVPDELLENNKYIQNNTITFDIANEKVTNPKTGNYFILICSIIILLDILFLLVFYKKQTIRNYLIILGILFIPITASAICNANLECETNVEISKVGPICKRATTLHTETCAGSGTGCYSEGYLVGGRKNTNIITYGNLGTDGSLVAGDAFDCDVNNDGVYDEATERFYYVSNYYDVENSTFDSTKAALIYYSNVDGGTSQNPGYYAYATKEDAQTLGTCTAYESCSWYGPATAFKQLPSTTQWSNDQIIVPGTRNIKNELGTNTVTGNTIQAFTYTDKAARLLTTQEMMDACQVSRIHISSGELGNCIFLFENIDTFYRSSSSSDAIEGYWLETPYSNSNDYLYTVYGTSREAEWYAAYYHYNHGVRPVITVLKENMEY